MFLREQANQLGLEQYFRPGLSAVYIPEGPAGASTQLIQGTQLERLLVQAYQEGVVVGTSSVGSALLSKTMLVGFQPGFGRGNSLSFGAVKLDPSALPGLNFGLNTLVIDPYFYRRGRFGRMLNAIALPESPGIGLGIDHLSGVKIINEQVIANAFGEFGVTILDSRTYHAGDSVTYQGDDHQLRLRNVLFHLLAAGKFQYDIQKLQHSLSSPPKRIERRFETLMLPPEAGPLIISSNLRADSVSAQMVNLLANLSGGKNARITAVFLDAPDSPWFEDAAALLQRHYSGSLQITTPPVDINRDIDIPADTTGIILWGADQSIVNTSQLEPIKKLWLSGIPMLTADAGTAAVGRFFSAHPANPETELAAERLSQGTLRKGGMQINVGLGLIDAIFEPNLLNNNRWGRMIALTYSHPDLVAFGLNQNASIILDESAAKVAGQNQVVALDLRSANLALGDNQVFVIANGMLDVFTGSDILTPEDADMDHIPLSMATPVLPKFIPTRTATSIVTPGATKTPLPSGMIKTPPANFSGIITPTPTPTEELKIIDQRYLRAMIFFSLLSVGIVVLGIWIHHLRINSR